jgi:hypothetical protein
MNVAALQSFLKNLAGTLEQADGRAVAKDLEQVCQGLEPFRELRVKDFADFLVRAEQYTRDPNLLTMGRRRGRPPAQPADPEKVRNTALAVRSLEDRATDNSVSMADIKAQLDQLGQPLTGEEAVDVAREVGIAMEGRMTKAAALRQIRHRIEERKRSAVPTRTATTPATTGDQGACVTPGGFGTEQGTVTQPQ